MIRKEDLEKAQHILLEAKNVEGEITALFYSSTYVNEKHTEQRVRSADHSLFTIIETCSLLRTILKEINNLEQEIIK